MGKGRLAFAAVSALALILVFQNCSSELRSQPGSSTTSASNGSNSNPNPVTTPGQGPAPAPAPAPLPLPAPQPQPFLNQWTALNIVGAPLHRDWMPAVWAGTKMIIWGGNSCAIPANNASCVSLNTGGVYDDVTKTWSAMSTVGAPSARAKHTAVWTGTRMIVFGGALYGNPFPAYGDGASYDPATNTWAPISTAGAPTPRSWHTAVWTGTRMIIWGGFRNVGGTYEASNNGASYDPATNTWSPIAAAPIAARSGHTAVLAGNKMIVWGGTSAGGFLSDGAIYDVATDSWTLLPTAGAPTARQMHTASYTGAKMIVFGGYTSAGNATTHAAYNMQTNQWEPISTVNAPASQGQIYSVWTGKYMIVHSNGGGAYDPALNTWTPLSTVAAPIPANRIEYGLVWTGTKAILFGGYGGGVTLGDAYELK